MAIARAAAASRFDPERLFRPRSAALIGQGRLADIVAANLSTFSGPVQVVAPGATPAPADLAVVATDGENVGPVLQRLAASGIYAAVSLGLAPDIAAGQAATGVRVLGPGSFGMACPEIGLNATLSHLQPRPGRVALVSQSAALCRAVLDWAEPNGVGFSQVVGVGGSAGTGFSTVLDYLSHDRSTGPILLDIRRIRDPRAFLSAARAAARLRPVLAIRAGGRLLDATGRADAVWDAALKRAGVLTVSRLEDMLAALETLTRAPPPRSEAVAIVTNAIGPGQMAADAALEAGIPLAELRPETKQVLRLAFPAAETRGVIYVGVAIPTRLSEAAAMLAGAAEVGGVLVVLAPTGPADAAGVAALAATPRGRVPLLVCAMGETTGAVHRRALAAAGIPAFPSPEQAVQGFSHLLRDRRARAAARELPPSDVLELRPDKGARDGILAAARAAGRLDLAPQEVWALLAIYGIISPPALRVALADDQMFGPAIELGDGRTSERGFDLPPLNLPLAHGLVEHTAAARLLPGPSRDALADTLVRLSQLAVDCPELATLTVGPQARASLRPAGERHRLAFAPYPVELSQTVAIAGEQVLIRPIRPEDAVAHTAFFNRIGPEDRRMRFFASVRELSPERMARLTQVDYEREMAFVAKRSNDETVGVSRLIREGDEGEFAILVQPDMKGRGLARQLMSRIVAWGQGEGIRVVIGEILSENLPMLAFIRRLGFTVRHLPDEPGIVEARLDLPG